MTDPTFSKVQELPGANALSGSDILPLAQGATALNAASLDAIRNYILSTIDLPESGKDGRTILNGAGAPVDELGENGDFYFDRTSSTLYGPKFDDAWADGIQVAGSTGPAAWAAPVAWETGKGYTADSPRSIVTQGGESYACLTSHTSGTFATDLVNGAWIKIAKKGADGSGSSWADLSGTPTDNDNISPLGAALIAAADADEVQALIGNAPTPAPGTEYQTVAASQTAQPIGANGAVGDLLANLLVVPASLSPGAVQIKDGTDSAITVFAGGANSLKSLQPFSTSLGLRSTKGAWQVSTGASVSVIAAYTPWNGPTPDPEADFLVTNDAEFAAANLAATAGQVIQLQDSGTFGTLTITNATGITVRGQTPKVPRVKYLKLVGATNCTVTGLYIHPGELAASTQRCINILNTSTRTSDGVKIIGNKIYGGNPWNDFEPFDVTVTDGPRMGTTGNWSTVNDYLDLPYSIGSLSTAGGELTYSGSITIADNEITDMREGIKLSWNGGGNVTITGNKIGRVYQDGITVAFGSSASGITGIDISGNEIFDLFSQPQDNRNPHGDYIQLSATGYTAPVPNLRVLGNMCYYTPGCRGEAQGALLSDNGVGYPFVGPLIADNMLISRITGIGITLANGTGGAAWGYILRNSLLSNPSNNSLMQNELLTNSVSGIGPSTRSVRSINARNDVGVAGSLICVSANITEAITSNAGLESAGNIITGVGDTATAYGSNANPTTGAAWNAVDTASEYFAAYRTAATAGKGPGIGGSTAEAVMAAWADPANRPYSSIPAWVAWPDQTGAAVNEQVSSGWAFVHAPGPSRSVTITGGQYRTATDASGSGASAWGTSGTVSNGQYMQVRMTSSTEENATSVLGWNIGGATGDWSVTTVSTAAYPEVLFTSPVRVVRTGVIGPDGDKITIGFKLKFPSANPAANIELYCPLNASGGIGTLGVRVRLLTTGLLRFNLIAATGTSVCQVDCSGASLCDGAEHEILFSADLSQTVAANGRDVYVDGVNRTAAGGTWTGGEGVVIGYNAVSSGGGYGFGGTLSTSWADNVSYYYMNIAERADLSSATVRSKFDASAIGRNGSGVTGTQPHTFLTGTASQWNNAAGINWGSAGAYIKAGTGIITDVSGESW